MRSGRSATRSSRSVAPVRPPRRSSTAALALETGSGFQVLNAVEGLARVALSRGDVGEATRQVDALLAHAGGGDPGAPETLAGTYEHLCRLTMVLVWTALGDGRAAELLAAAHARLIAEADRIRDADLRERFLTRIGEHREIVRLHAGRPEVHAGDRPAT